MKPIALAVNGGVEYALMLAQVDGKQLKVHGCHNYVGTGEYMEENRDFLHEALRRPDKPFLALLIRPKPRLQSKAKLRNRKHVQSRGWKPALLTFDMAALSTFWAENVGPLPEAGEVDWRPTETVPEDYYAL